MTGLTQRALRELVDDPLAVARLAPLDLLWCPEHPGSVSCTVYETAPKRCGECGALLQLRPEATA